MRSLLLNQLFRRYRTTGEKPPASLKLLEKLLEVGDVDIVKHVPGIKGYNAGITFDDDRGVSMPGDTLEEALENLAGYWQVEYQLRANSKPTGKERKLALTESDTGVTDE